MIELLAEWRVLRQASKRGRHRRQREKSRHERRSQTRASPRTHASLHKTRTTASSRPCDRRPARDRVGDPRCCSRWGCNSGPERKPAYEAIVGAGRQPSLLSGISDRQLPVDGAVRMPRAQQSRRAGRDDCIARTMRKPDRTKLPAVAALLLSSDLRLLVRHERTRRVVNDEDESDGTT